MLTLFPQHRSATLTADGKEFALTPDHLAIERKTFKQSSK